MKFFFGTDGIRGHVNKFLTPNLAFEVGKAAAIVIGKKLLKTPVFLVGKDTRISGDMLESALCSGMCQGGAKVILTSVIPTPAIAFLVRKYNFDSGVVISASHNPYYDNGIKFFNNQGYKISDQLEEEIETYMTNKEPYEILDTQIGTITYSPDLATDYKFFLNSIINDFDFSNYKIIVDCANGSTYKIASDIFKKISNNCNIIFNKPNGININDNCGSTHLNNLQKDVLNNKANIGIAFDGDGDRCLLVDEHGDIVDGDQIMCICAIYLRDKELLNNNGFVSTIMSNLGLFKMADEKGFTVLKSKVGDRYVLEEMIKKGYNFGGEQSGHIIFLDYNATGDGILTALQVLKIMKETNKTLSELKNQMKIFPQVLLNAKVQNDKKNDFENNNIIISAIKDAENKFKDNGRVLIRPSGTESLIRVMIEGEDYDDIFKEAKKIHELIEKELS